MEEPRNDLAQPQTAMKGNRWKATGDAEYEHLEANAGDSILSRGEQKDPERKLWQAIRYDEQSVHRVFSPWDQVSE